MFSNLENAIIIAAIVWGLVSLTKHFMPSSWEKYEKWSDDAEKSLHKRIDELETELGLKKEQK